MSENDSCIPFGIILLRLNIEILSFNLVLLHTAKLLLYVEIFTVVDYEMIKNQNEGISFYYHPCPHILIRRIRRYSVFYLLQLSKG